MAGRPKRRARLARLNAGKVATLHGVDMGDYPEAAAYYAREQQIAYGAVSYTSAAYLGWRMSKERS